ncbi:MAG: 50S ribosomal protein L7/L12 [Candidatus Spechtbacterales bacterium]
MTKEEKKDEATATDPSRQGEAEVEEKEVEVPKKFKDLVSEIEKMSVLELSELVKVLEDKFGVSSAAPMVMAGGAAPAAEAEAEEGGLLSVELTGGGDNKIGVIKALREVLPELGLKDAKDLTEAAPKVIKEGVEKAEAEEIKKKLEEVGAKVTLK